MLFSSVGIDLQRPAGCSRQNAVKQYFKFGAHKCRGASARASREKKRMSKEASSQATYV